MMIAMRSFGALATCITILAGCGGESGSVATATCERRDECGNLMGLSVDECVSLEEEYLASLGSQRGACEAAYDACLDGAICDDFRECHADIGPDVCGCPDVFVRLVDPVDGQTITPADDADPSDAQIQYDFVIETGCLEETEQVELVLLAPVMSSYGFGAPDARGVVVIRPPLIPGENRFVARGTASGVMSAEITVTVAP